MAVSLELWEVGNAIHDFIDQLMRPFLYKITFYIKFNTKFETKSPTGGSILFHTKINIKFKNQFQNGFSTHLTNTQNSTTNPQGSDLALHDDIDQLVNHPPSFRRQRLEPWRGPVSRSAIIRYPVWGSKASFIVVAGADGMYGIWRREALPRQRCAQDHGFGSHLLHHLGGESER